jgi:aminoglycoside phosphotransferase (APT) family kinase protein
VCHNDLAPVTTIYFDHRPIAFIDWDFAAPAPSLWDVAYAAWSFVLLSSDEFCRRYGYSTDARGPRLRAFCDAYGMDERDRGRLLDTVRRGRSRFSRPSAPAPRRATASARPPGRSRVA